MSFQGWLTSRPLPEQEKFLEISRLHFRTVPSNPHYFFYCPPSSRREVRSSSPSACPTQSLSESF